MRAMAFGKMERQILLGVPVLFAAGAALHFLYDFSGAVFFVGLFAPVNESVWEHLKLVLWPATLWWATGYLVGGRRRAVDAPAWFAASLGALLTMLCAIPLLFYFYTGAFGVEALGADIALFFAAVALGQCVGLRIYHRGSNVSWVVPVLAQIALLVLFVVLTLAPPDLPLFCDPVAGVRGIFQS